MSWSLGPGLTSQLGPFKVNKRDFPNIQTRPWKGGGVPAGGQKHAGHGTWMTTMNPISTPVIFPQPSMTSNYSKYASVVTSLDINNKKFTKNPSAGRFSKPYNPMGTTQVPETGFQKPGMGVSEENMARENYQQNENEQGNEMNFSSSVVSNSPIITTVPLQTSGINFEIKSEQASSSTTQTNKITYSDANTQVNPDYTNSHTQANPDNPIMTTYSTQTSPLPVNMESEITILKHEIESQTDPIIKDELMQELAQMKEMSTSPIKFPESNRLQITGNTASVSTDLVKQYLYISTEALPTSFDKPSPKKSPIYEFKAKTARPRKNPSPTKPRPKRWRPEGSDVGAPSPTNGKKSEYSTILKRYETALAMSNSSGSKKGEIIQAKRVAARLKKQLDTIKKNIAAKAAKGRKKK